MDEKALNTTPTTPALPDSQSSQPSISSIPTLTEAPDPDSIEKQTVTKAPLTDPASHFDDDPEIVRWDGDNDPELPLNWPSSQKWRNVVMVSALTFVT